MSYYEPTFDFTQSPEINIEIEHEGDHLNSHPWVMGAPDEESATGSDYHLTITVNSAGPNTPPYPDLSVECPTFSQASAGQTITIHVVVEGHPSGPIHKKSTSAVPTGAGG
ncbi:hypothetical protein KFE98_03230 [bacterium SCSIO 12741]|nr:hypothetical protein KFE98_03230 [bacterium SCSIO 12741]